VGVSLNNPQNYRFNAGADGKMKNESEAAYRSLNAPEESAELVGDATSGSSIGAVTGDTMTGLSPIDFIERTALDAQVSSDKILDLLKQPYTSTTNYPNAALGQQLRTIARFIAGGLPTRVFYVSLGGFDTHNQQPGAHDRLMRDLGDSLKAFCDDLKAQGNFERVMVMTFSEFGRRVEQNANNGTDHGAAAPMFLCGGGVKSGLLSTYPSLAPADLLNGDLKYTMDFRSVYAGVLERWLKTPSKPILGKAFDPLAVC
jgi:uncharacterized protein (DUF1501 family)